jgi:hypothetical protein
MPDAVTEWMDPFVLATIHLAMSEEADLRVHGKVSPSLIRNLDDFQRAWSVWKPLEFPHPVDVVGDAELEEDLSGLDRTAISTFSGGVDSSFTAYRHATGTGLRYPRRLTAGVMSHGFDIPLNEEAAFQEAARRSRTMLESIGMSLIPVSTNFRDLPLEWSYVHGAAIASTLMLFRKRFSEGLIGQTVAYEALESMREGVNAVTDWWLSTDSFTVIPDGAGFGRAEKIWALKDWPEFLENLRVCWAGPYHFKNCCRCEKCTRNILTFRVLGLGLPPCFESDVSNRQIRGLTRLKEFTMRVGYDGILRLARERGIDEPWVRELERCLKRNRRRHRSKIAYYSRNVKARIRRMRSDRQAG